MMEERMALWLKRDGFVANVICWKMSFEQKNRFLQHSRSSWTIFWRFILEALRSWMGLKAYFKGEVRQSTVLDLSEEYFTREVWLKLAIKLIAPTAQCMMLLFFGFLYLTQGLASVQRLLTIQVITLLTLVIFIVVFFYPTVKLHQAFIRFKASRGDIAKPLIQQTYSLEWGTVPQWLSVGWKLILFSLLEVFMFALILVAKTEGIALVGMGVGLIAIIEVLIIAFILALIAVFYLPIVRMYRAWIDIQIRKFVPMVKFV